MTTTRAEGLFSFALPFFLSRGNRECTVKKRVILQAIFFLLARRAAGSLLLNSVFYE